MESRNSVAFCFLAPNGAYRMPEAYIDWRSQISNGFANGNIHISTKIKRQSEKRQYDKKCNLDLRKAPALIFSCKHGKVSRVLFCYFVAKKSKIADKIIAKTGVMSGGRCFAFCFCQSAIAQNAKILRRGNAHVRPLLRNFRDFVKISPRLVCGHLLSE